MPIPFVASTIKNGLPWGLDYWTVTKVAAAIAILALVKWYCHGATNTAERQMHSKVIMVTVCVFYPFFALLGTMISILAANISTRVGQLA
jgi:small-conductance mechanosensitive channel